MRQVESHPAGVRGLKLAKSLNVYTSSMSHPAGVRGLKLARIDDCVLVESCDKPQTEEMKKALNEHGMWSFLYGLCLLWLPEE